MTRASLTCAAALLGSVLLGLALAGAAGAETMTFRLAMRSSITSPNGQNLVVYKNAVESATRGAISIDIRDKGQLYDDTQVPEAVRSGELEMAIIQVGLYAKQIPEVEIFQQPFLFDSDALIAAAIRPDSEIRKVIDGRILEKMGARVLYWQNYGPTLLMSKSEPMVHPDAMQRRSIRAFDSVSAEFVSLCGGQPQVVPYAKMLEAMQGGQVDAVMTGVFGVKQVELWREARHISRLNQSAIMLAVVINEGLWQKLAPRHREIMQAAALDAEIAYAGHYALAESDAYRFSAEKGMTIHEMSPEQLGEWRLCSSDLVERFVERLGDTAGTLMSAYGRLRTAACCNTAGQRAAQGR